jgi:hypothetical protein
MRLPRTPGATDETDDAPVGYACEMPGLDTIDELLIADRVEGNTALRRNSTAKGLDDLGRLDLFDHC